MTRSEMRYRMSKKILQIILAKRKVGSIFCYRRNCRKEIKPGDKVVAKTAHQSGGDSYMRIYCEECFDSMYL